MKKFIFILVMFHGIFMQANQKEFVVGIEDIQYLPFYANNNNKLSGYSAEVLELFAQKNGIKFVYRPLPVKRLYKELLDGSIDFKYPDNPNWNQAQKKSTKVFYSQGVANYIDGIIAKKENINKNILVKLGTIRGFTAWDYLDEIKSKKIQLQENENMDQLFGMLAKDRIDGAYLNIDVAKYYLKEHSLGGFDFNSKLKHTKDSYYLSSTKHEALLKEFNIFLTKNKKELQLLKSKYGIE